jgi:transcriptional regulator with XRE-family HTH domain
MEGSKKLRAPYLKTVRELLGMSQRKLAEFSMVDRITIRTLEQGKTATATSVAALAAAFGVLPEDLTGREGMSDEQMKAYLADLFAEQKTYGPGDEIYDQDPLAGLTDEQLVAFVRRDRTAHQRISVLLRQRARLQKAIAETATPQLEDLTHQDAG